MPVIIGGASVASGLINTFIGGGQKKKGQKILDNTPYPIEGMPSEITQNQKVAQNMAESGLPSAQYNQAMQNIQKNRNAAIQEANNRRAGIGLVGGIQDQSDNATLGLDVADAKQHIENQKNLMDVNNNVAAYKDKMFDWNVKNKYNKDYNYAMRLIGSGNQAQANGIDSMLGGAATAGAGLFGDSGRWKNSGY